MDSYLENAMDYVQSTFENANEWFKAHDPLKFPEVEAVCIAVSVGGGPYVGGPGCNSGSGGNGLGAPAAASSYSGGGGSNSFSLFGNTNAFGQAVDRFGMPYATDFMGKPVPPAGHTFNLLGNAEPITKIDIPAYKDDRIIHKFDHMGNIVNPNFPNIYITPSTPEQGSSEESKQGDNSDSDINSDVNDDKKTFGPKTTAFLGEWLTKHLGYKYEQGSSEESKQGDNKEEKQQEKKQCVTTNQKLVFANTGYYDKKMIEEIRLKEGNEQDSKVFETYEDKKLSSKASVITTKNGVASFNIAGTADPTEEGLENFIRDSLNNVLIGTNNLQGILKDRINWYISSIEKYNKESGNKQPLIINGHSSGGFEGIIISVLRPDLVSQVNMVDSPGAYDIVLKLVNGDKVKASEIYKKVEIYNGNRNIVNSKGSHPADKVIHHIDVSVHAIKEFPLEYKVTGAQEILGRCHSDSLCSYKDGEYKVERLRDGVTKKEIADYFGLSEGQIEVIDNNSLSDKDLAKFQNKISSKFKFKLSHERSQKEQCIY
ncbi:MAG: hypothetical protein RLZZ102_800 [Pseudomonadota bacterium]|jgi:hypothetical protein